MSEFQQAWQKAMSFIDVLLPAEIMEKSSGEKIQWIHDNLLEDPELFENVLRVQDKLRREMKRTMSTQPNLWKRVAMHFVRAALKTVRVRYTIEDQKQHRIPICMLSRFGDEYEEKFGRSLLKNPVLSATREINGEIFMENVSSKDIFLYEIPGMNQDAVEAFFGLIESSAWAPGHENEQIHKLVSFVILQYVRNYTVSSFESGTFTFIFNEIEKNIPIFEYRRAAVVNFNKGSLPLAPKYMNRIVTLNGEENFVFPIMRDRAIVFHSGNDEKHLEDVVELAKIDCIEKALEAGDTVYGLSSVRD